MADRQQVQVVKFKFIKKKKTEQNKQKQKHFSDKKNVALRSWDTIALLKKRIVDCMIYEVNETKIPKPLLINKKEKNALTSHWVTLYH